MVNEIMSIYHSKSTDKPCDQQVKDIQNNGPVCLDVGQSVDIQKIVINADNYNVFYKGMHLKGIYNQNCCVWNSKSL